MAFTIFTLTLHYICWCLKPIDLKVKYDPSNHWQIQIKAIYWYLSNIGEPIFKTKPNYRSSLKSNHISTKLWIADQNSVKGPIIDKKGGLKTKKYERKSAHKDIKKTTKLEGYF